MMSFLLVTSNLYSQSKVHGLKKALKNPEDVTTLYISCPHHYPQLTVCDTIPEEISQLINLKHFRGTESKFRSLPKSFVRLTKLESFTVSENDNFNLNELCKLKELPNLSSLSIFFIKSTKFPNCLSEIETLKSVDISGNENLDLVHSISLLEKLPKLRYLKLHLNETQKIPKNIYKLNHLEHLDLSFSETKKVKRLIKHLNPNLRGINLSNCNLSMLPKSVLKLNKLIGLDLSDNWFNQFPEKLSELEKLKYLSLRNNNWEVVKLEEFPEDLIHLEFLDLSNTEFDSIPYNITQMKRLKFLNLLGCKLKVFPHHLKELKSLRYLNLDFAAYSQEDVDKLRSSLPNCQFSSEAVGKLENANLIETMQKWE